MKSRLTVVLAVALVLVVSLSLGANSASAAKASHKAAMVTDLTGLSGHGFNDIAWEGFKQAKERLGVEITLVESREQSDYELNIRKLASQNCDMTVGVGFLLTDAIVKVAEEFPGSNFALIDAVPDDVPSNLRCYVFREEEGSFLAGYLAAKVSKTSKIGFVGGMDFPLIRKFEAGFRAGAQTANSKVRVVAGYVGSFTDPVKGKQIADMMFNQGADIVYHAAGESGLGAIDAVKTRPEGFYVIGVDMDQDELAPGKVLTSVLKKVDAATFSAIRDAVSGTFEAGVVTLGIKEGGVGLSPMKYTKSKVPAQVLDEVRKYEEALRAGKFLVPETLEDLKGFAAPAI